MAELIAEVAQSARFKHAFADDCSEVYHSVHRIIHLARLPYRSLVAASGELELPVGGRKRVTGQGRCISSDVMVKSQRI